MWRRAYALVAFAVAAVVAAHGAPTLTWTLNLERGSVNFGRYIPYAGNTYPITLTGGDAGKTYTAYVMSDDGLTCLAQSVVGANSAYSITFNTEEMYSAFQRDMHEMRTFHCLFRDSEKRFVAEGDITILWNPQWAYTATIAGLYPMRGPQGDRGDKGKKGERGGVDPSAVAPKWDAWHGYTEGNIVWNYDTNNVVQYYWCLDIRDDADRYRHTSQERPWSCETGDAKRGGYRYYVFTEEVDYQKSAVISSKLRETQLYNKIVATNDYLRLLNKAVSNYVNTVEEQLELNEKLMKQDEESREAAHEKINMLTTNEAARAYIVETNLQAQIDKEIKRAIQKEDELVAVVGTRVTKSGIVGIVIQRCQYVENVEKSVKLHIENKKNPHKDIAHGFPEDEIDPDTGEYYEWAKSCVDTYQKGVVDKMIADRQKVKSVNGSNPQDMGGDLYITCYNEFDTALIPLYDFYSYNPGTYPLTNEYIINEPIKFTRDMILTNGACFAAAEQSSVAGFIFENAVFKSTLMPNGTAVQTKKTMSEKFLKYESMPLDKVGEDFTFNLDNAEWTISN